MSLAIDVDKVVSVLLADGWHEVLKESFELDSYEFTWSGSAVHGGGQSGVCATGFTFLVTEQGIKLAGPLTAILAVRYRP